MALNEALVRHSHGLVTLTLRRMLLHDLRWGHVVACRDQLFVAFGCLDRVALDGAVVGHADGVGGLGDFTALRGVLTLGSAVAIALVLSGIRVGGGLDVQAVEEVVEHLLG